MFQFIKNILRELNLIPGKYKVLACCSSGDDFLYSKKGESLKELFKRRDRIIIKHIQDGYPEMTEKEFMDIGVDTIEEKRYRLSADLPEDKIGVVLETRDGMRHIQIYRLVG